MAGRSKKKKMIITIILHTVIIDFESFEDWDYASSNYVLSEEVIRRAADKVNWTAICKYQDVSHELLLEFGHRINIDALYYSNYIKYETVRQFLRQLKRSQRGGPRRPTRAIKRAIRQNQMLQQLRFKDIPNNVLRVVQLFLCPSD